MSIFGSGINPGFAEHARHPRRRDLRPGRLRDDARVGRLHRVRLPRDRAQGRVRPTDRRPRAAGDGAGRHRGVRGRGAPRRRRARHRARPTCAAWPSSRQTTADVDMVVDHRHRAASPASAPAGRAGSATARWSTCGCAGARARPWSPTGRSARATSSRSRASRRAAEDGDLPAARLRGQDLRRLHGARHDHDRACPRSTPSRRCARRRPASSPTSTCRSSPPRGFVPLELTPASEARLQARHVRPLPCFCAAADPSLRRRLGAHRPVAGRRWGGPPRRQPRRDACRRASVQRCIEKARASGYDSVLTSAVSPAESGVVRRRRVLGAANASTSSRSTSTTAPAPALLPLEKAARRDRAAVLELDDLSFDEFWRLGPVGLKDALDATPSAAASASAVTATASSRTRSPASPAGSATCSGSRCTPTRAGSGWGHALVADALAWVWRHGGDRAYVNTQLENTACARALPVVRVRDPSRPACASSAARCDRRRPRHPRGRGCPGRAPWCRARRFAPRPAARAERGADVRARRTRARGSRPAATFLMRFDAAERAARSPGRAHGARPARSRGPRSTQSVSGGNLPPTRDLSPFAFDELPDRPATGQRMLLVPHRRDSATTACIPLEVDLRSASDESLAHFVTHVVVAPVGADGALTVGAPAQRGVGVATAGRARLRGRRGGADQPGRRSPTSSRRAGSAARRSQLGGEHRRAAHAGAESRDARRVEHARGPKSPDLAAGVAAVRTPRACATRCSPVRSSPSTCPSIVRDDLEDVVTPAAGVGARTRAWPRSRHSSVPHRRPEHRAARPPRRRVAAAAPERERPPTRGRRHRSSRRSTRSTRPRTRTRCRPCAGDDSSAVTVLATDDGLEQFLTGDDPPALRAAHLLAGLALVAGEQPSITRGIAIANPDRWDADDTFVAAVLAGLRNNPLLHATTVAGTARRGAGRDRRRRARRCTGVPPAGAVRRRPGRRSRRAVRQAATADRDAVAALVGRRRPARRRAPTGRWRRRWRPLGEPGRPARPRAACSIRSAPRSTGYLGQVEVQPPSTITITSSKAEIPISFRNNERRRRHRPHASSRATACSSPTAPSATSCSRRTQNTTVRVAVETRGSGTVAGAPDRHDARRPRDRRARRSQVRSTFVSGVGVFLTVGAIVFLAHLVGLGHPPATQEALASSTPPSAWRRPPGSPRD